MKPIDVEPHDLETLHRILAHHLSEYDVYAFGSRVTGKARKTSDLDLVIMTERPLDHLRAAEVKEAFSESDLPFKIDLVDWADTSQDFRKLIEAQRLKIQDRKN